MVLVIPAVALLGRAVAAAAVELLHVLVIVAAAVLGLGAAGLVAVVAFRVRQARQEPPRVVHRITPAPSRPSQPVPGAPRQFPSPQQPPTVQGGGHHPHLHLGGLSAAERAEVMRQLCGG